MLVDYDNAFPPSRGLDSPEFRHVLIEYVRIAQRVHPGLEELWIRLYGGWTTDDVLSRRGSEVASLAATADPFPIFADTGVIRGRVELARSLVSDPGLVFSNTYRRRGSVPRLRLAQSPPEGCAEHENCPATLLMRFTKTNRKQCPADTCGVVAGEAFVVHEQKMVDTLMSCDLLEAAGDARLKGVLVVSDDTDFVPPLVYAARARANAVHLVSPGGTMSAEFTDLLRVRGVQVWDPEGHVDGTR